jgi:GT2 family glycosyltransferase
MKNGFSILICTNNRVKQLKECLISISGQISLVDEIIIVDSSDKPVGYKDIYKSCKKIKLKYFKTKIKSIPYSRNILLKKAENNFCMFVDDDVCLDKDAVLKCKCFFKKNPHVVMVGGVGYPKFSRNIYSSYSYKTLFLSCLRSRKRVISVPFCPTMICGFRRKKILDYGLSFDLKMKSLEDVDICLELRKRGERICISKEIKGIHEYRTDFKSFYLSFYNYYLYTKLIYEKHGKDFFDMKRFLGKCFWLQSFFYLLNFKGDYLLYNFSRKKLVNFWLYFLRKLAMINAVTNQKYIQK